MCQERDGEGGGRRERGGGGGEREREKVTDLVGIVLCLACTYLLTYVVKK